ncbi:MAG: hypothetical protein HC911_12085 [Chloroflexaceae bacterium]|nr:hypothetical protein [Chloroflexaceae bacterium]
MLFFIVYDQQHVTTLVRDWSADQLYQALQREQFGTVLPPPDQRVLAALLVDWQRRALGQVMLRDAMLVDQRRGAQVYRLLCYSQIRAAQPIPEIAAHLFTPCVPQPDLAHLHAQITALAAAPDCPPPRGRTAPPRRCGGAGAAAGYGAALCCHRCRWAAAADPTAAPR